MYKLTWRARRTGEKREKEFDSAGEAMKFADICAEEMLYWRETKTGGWIGEPSDYGDIGVSHWLVSPVGEPA